MVFRYAAMLLTTSLIIQPVCLILFATVFMRQPPMPITPHCHFALMPLSPFSPRR